MGTSGRDDRAILGCGGSDRAIQADLSGFFFFLAQRARAAFEAEAWRSLAVSWLLVTLAPRRPSFESNH